MREMSHYVTKTQGPLTFILYYIILDSERKTPSPHQDRNYSSFLYIHKSTSINQSIKISSLWVWFSKPFPKHQVGGSFLRYARSRYNLCVAAAIVWVEFILIRW